ncbi:hypothetical protein SELMODRAFT_268023 [Selaginella moellendorffii]|uniref:demethylphylloquinone reductase n=1 Tax=Selaginella moellendorffii TaxID=88036 RepID=D8S0F2_SELML|nr:alternative NAD(P)H-ubiquinone oxidoreductase C1, chloroplastic/mitochondrial [Selaginella moellendorffii]EFJ21917.1 hypothetical protein SELMODRAFT_268023 [Selaginella moellendorffii]|eukprot:XP_002976807.1 alternative NAD(P)H-ubiquinone oxidoreductase C1, chloroplastic/mitochondrial [Selaginella moellendorffii]
MALGCAALGSSPCASLPGASHSFAVGSKFCSRLWFSARPRGGRFRRLQRWENSSRSLLFARIRALSSKSAGGSDDRSTTSEKSLNPYVWSDRKSPRICILGGGFGGLYTALRLDSLVWTPEKRPQILLVDQSERFVFKPMLYELLSKEVDVWEVAPLFADLLASTTIRFLKDNVKSVSPFDAVADDNKSSPSSIGGKVYLESGIQVEYDWLVLALGAETKMDMVPGALEHALPFSTLEDALRLEKRLEELERERFGPKQLPIDVAVVGSGYCGIELSATVAERLGERGRVQVIDVNSEICPSAPTGNREKASKVLSSRNVKLELGYFVTNIALKDSNEPEKKNKRVVLELKPANSRNTRKAPPSTFLEADLVLWTVGGRALVPKAFPTNGRGQTDTDETLRVKGHPRIFAIGDSAGNKDSSGRLLQTTAQVALQQADYAGWNLWAAINNRPLLPFRYQHLGEMMTLGRYNGAVTPSFFEDITLDGVLGHTARKLAYLYRLPTNEHRVKVGVSWLAKSAVDAFSYVQGTVLSLAQKS